MGTKKQNKTKKASEILDHLEGTLIADIKSLKMCAIELIGCSKSDFGHLNYTTLLVGLVGCETLGMYVNGADLHYKLVDSNKTQDVGSYISR